LGDSKDADQVSTDARDAGNQPTAVGQRRALELQASGAPLEASLTELVKTAEDQCSQEIFASILLMDADGKHLRHGAAPSLPEAYCKAIDGIEIGPSQGSCGTAAYYGRTIVVDDVQHSALWTSFKELAGKHGLRACWSTPILSPSRKVLGTFALYHRTVAVPSRRDIELVSLLVGTAAELLERSRNGA
jgi:GAF domain-containing protein